MIVIGEAVAPEWWTPHSQEDEESPARFKLRRLTGMQIAHVKPETKVVTRSFLNESGTVEEVPALEISGRGMELLLQYGLEDWENVNGPKGPLPCNSQNWQHLGADLIHEAGLEIYSRSMLKEDERKNS